MGWLIGILTFILVVACVLLSLLILAQKPKKDTGGGLAFGGAATDALFGAGSGDLFTKLTKYTTVVFFVLVLFLSILNAQQSKRRVADPRARVTAADRQAEAVAATTAASAVPSGSTGTVAATTPSAAPTNAPLLLSPKATNVPVAIPAVTNAAPKPEAGKK